MTNETERTRAQRTAHAMRAAAIRAAMTRVPGESDPTLAYGCVDWFRYDGVLVKLVAQVIPRRYGKDSR